MHGATNTEQPRIDDDQLRIDDTKDREGVKFWNESANETDSNSDCSERFDEEKWDSRSMRLDGELGESRTERKAVIEIQVRKIK